MVVGAWIASVSLTELLTVAVLVTLVVDSVSLVDTVTSNRWLLEEDEPVVVEVVEALPRACRLTAATGRNDASDHEIGLRRAQARHQVVAGRGAVAVEARRDVVEVGVGQRIKIGLRLCSGERALTDSGQTLVGDGDEPAHAGVAALVPPTWNQPDWPS